MNSRQVNGAELSFVGQGAAECRHAVGQIVTDQVAAQQGVILRFRLEGEDPGILHDSGKDGIHADIGADIQAGPRLSSMDSSHSMVEGSLVKGLHPPKGGIAEAGHSAASCPGRGQRTIGMLGVVFLDGVNDARIDLHCCLPLAPHRLA